MGQIRIFNGLHDGTQVDLPVGQTVVGSGSGCNLILLDEGVPSHLLTVSNDEDGQVTLLWLAENFELFDESGRQAVVSLPLPLSSQSDALAWHIRLAATTVGLYCAASRHPAQSGANPEDAPADLDAPDSRGQRLVWLSRWPALERAWNRAVESPLLSTPRRRHAAAAALACALLACFYVVARSAMPAAAGDVLAKSKPLFDALELSWNLTLDHRAPAVLREDLLDDKSLLRDSNAESETQSAGRDSADVRGLKLSTELTTGLNMRTGDALTEQVLAFFHERAAQSPWVSRMVFNTQGTKIIARAVLSESERQDFERLLAIVNREYGQQVSFRISIDPLELPIQLQIKQVLGGATPVAILEDGSRLTPGSYYEGRLVESITVERIVLRGKDRIEIPI